MKRKLWIILVAVQMLTVLWCGAATADRTFTLMNKTITVRPDSAGHIEWTISGYEIQAIRIMHSYHEGDYKTGSFHNTVVAELEPARNFYDLPYETAKSIMYENTDSVIGSWYVAAYYGDGEYDCISEYFTVNLEAGTLTATPETVCISPDVPGVVNWSVTCFRPRKTAVMCCYREGSDDHTVKVMVKEVDHTAASFTLSFDEVWEIKKEHPFGNWYVYAWYGDNDDEYLSVWFEIETTTGTISLTDEQIKLEPGKDHPVTWSLEGFEARKIEIAYESWTGGSDINTTAAELNGDKDYYYLSYGKAKDTMKDTYGRWCVRAFYGNGEDDYTEDSFYVSFSTGSASVETETVHITTDTPGNLKWKTSGYIPIKTDVIYSYREGDKGKTTIVKTLSRGTTSCALYFDETHSVVSEHPYGSWGIRVYYGDGDAEFNYAGFVSTFATGTISVTAKTIIVTPDGNNGPTSDGYNVLTWTVDGFTPEKYEIVYFWWEGDWLTGGNHSSIVRELNGGVNLYHPEFFESREMERDHLFSGHWLIRAYYGSGDNDYVADGFSLVYETGYVIAEPNPLSVTEDTPGHLTWYTSGFAPRQYKLEYIYWEDNVYFGTRHEIRVKEMNGTAASCDLSWDEVQNTIDQIPESAVSGGWFLKAYYGEGENDCNSCEIDVRYLIRGFTTQPQGGIYQGNNGYAVTWETNFPTTSIRIFEVDDTGEPVQDHPVAFIASRNATCYVIYLPEGKNTCRFRIMAGYGPDSEDYILSLPFTVSRYAFSQQPRSGFFTGLKDDGDHTPFYRAVWDTTFIPTALYIFSTDENGVRDTGDEMIVLRPNITDKQYDIPIPVSEGYERCYRILARYGSNPSDCIWSNVFRITHATVLRYDTEVDVSYVDGGKLHFLTNYVPVKAELYLHSPVDEPVQGTLPLDEFDLYDTIYPITTDCYFEFEYDAVENGSVARIMVQFQRDGDQIEVYTTGTLINKEPKFLEFGGPGGPIPMDEEDYLWGYLSFDTSSWEIFRRPAGEEDAEWELTDQTSGEEPRDCIEAMVKNEGSTWTIYDYFIRAYTLDGGKWADSDIVQVEFEGCAFQFNGTLDKVYDGKPVEFNPCDSETLVVYGGNKDWEDMAAWGEVRFFWRQYSEESKRYIKMTEGNIPTAVGRYQLIIQEKDEEIWTDALTVFFRITETAAETWNVTFDSQDGSETPPQTVDNGETAREPDEPLKIGACFGGWFTDAECTEENRFSFDTPVMDDLMLFAKWIVPEPEGFLNLPASLTTIEADAFSGINAQAVIIPETVTAIEGNPFAGSSVQYIYGFNSIAQEFASTYHYAFILIDDAWMAVHAEKGGDGD